MFCCSEALFVCGGGRFYYCEHCHDRERKYEDCFGVNCPLGVAHPPPSDKVKLSAMPLGCSACRAKILEANGGNDNAILVEGS